MKVCIKENELNWNYHKVFGEEKAKTDGYTIFDVTQGYEDCAFSDFDDNGFNAELYNKRKQGYKNQIKLNELINWFDNYFDKQLTQSQWQDDFKPSYDTLFKKEYKDINELKTQAQIIRNQIKELRGK